MGHTRGNLSHNESLLRDIGASALKRSLGVNDVLVEQGDEADEVFVVLTGRLAALNRSERGDLVVGSVGPGHVVGEVTVIAGGRRTATLRATEPTEVAVIARRDFEHWLAENPEATDAVSNEARARIDRSQVATMIADLVGDAEPGVVQEVLDQVAWRHLSAGELLFEEGDQADACFFVVAGRLLVSARAADGASEPLAELGRGEVVGELGLLDRAPRSATVRALRDTTLAVFSAEVFDALVTRSPALMLHVARALLTRFRVTPRRAFRRAAALTIAATRSVDARSVVDDLVASVARFGSVRHLSSTRVDALLNRPDVAQAPTDNVGVPRLVEFLHEAEVGNDFVVLEADTTLTGWTRRVLRQSDRVVILTTPFPTNEELSYIDALLEQVRDLDYVAVMLAVVHPAGASRPRGTAQLLRRLRVDDVVHVREGSAAHAARLGRLASGNGVGLVLSGGGARGFAHLGVYRALVEAGVPVDAVGGCSIGAPLGAAMAGETPFGQLVDVVQRQFAHLLDYTLPVVSLVKGQRISASIEAAMGDWDIEDLWLPYYCVSTNLTRSQLEVHRRGSAARAVRASVAIPGILPPVPMGEDLLVDGGVLNNMPFEAMRSDRRIDTVIAVDVAPDRGPRAKSDYGTSVSGFRALASTIRPGGGDYPSVASVLLRSMLVGAVHNQRLSSAAGTIDLLLKLELPGVGLLDFKRVAEVADRGYAASIGTVSEWATRAGWSVAA
ncbi:MAG TPA: cyclic nucleotide-binding and patatin-like phospholipase domain-containing protein [Ilumatobacter sp.]|nr:cyclic nucleotide-binding and patatin-like phospholipase domain-containing protein [Ilumatobacter sp.]